MGALGIVGETGWDFNALPMNWWKLYNMQTCICTTVYFVLIYYVFIQFVIIFISSSILIIVDAELS